jgi:hypothetical protein
MDAMAGISLEDAYPYEAHGVVRVAHLFSFLCCDVCCVFLRLVSCVPNFPGFSRLSILDGPSVFSIVYYIHIQLCHLVFI